MKYRCLVLDHDDTVAMSTPQIHYPAFVDTLSVLRPGMRLTLEEFWLASFEPGFSTFCHETLGFTQEEMAFQLQNWQRHAKKQAPKFYAGIAEIVRRQKEGGGLVCVVSHSYAENILRDYRVNGCAVPDAVFGWADDERRRKPSPYPLLEIMARFGLAPKDLIVVDDLKPGYDMAKSCGVDFACAGWAHRFEKIEQFMRAHCDYYFDEVSKLESFLFSY